MAERPLNFAVVGCGMLAQSTHIPNLARSEQAALHTCCDLSDEALRVCREVYGALHTTGDYRAAIEEPDVDAVVIATTERMRLPIIEVAAAVKKPVYVEKPLAPTLEEMYRIRDVVKSAGIPFCVGHNRRSSPAMQDAHRIFRAHMEDPRPCPWRFDREGPDKRAALPENGVAGMSVRINDDWYSWKGWVFNKDEAQHGPMLFEMTHFTDLCNWFLAAEPAEVTALESGMLNHGVVIRYATGEMATLCMYANGTFGYPKELYEMFGNGGAVVVDHMLEVRTAGIEGVEPRIVYPIEDERFRGIGEEGGLFGWLERKRAACREAVEKGDTNLIMTSGPDKGHARALERFIDEIRGKGPMVCGVDDAIAATRTAFAAIASAQQKRVVAMEEI